MFHFFYERRRVVLPCLDNQLLLKSGSHLAKLIRSRKIKSREAVEVFISRIEQVNSIINAVVYKRYEDALREAEQIDNILDQEVVPEEFSESNCPFLGVPITVKESIGVKGSPFTSGLLQRKYTKAEQDAECVKLLKKAGVVVIGSTNTSELCMWYESNNLVYGRTCNSYHQGRIVGGSSGGEGCLQSVGGSSFGVGADIGGSIRMPAFFNGVFGHKVTTNVVSNEGQFPIEKGCTLNMMCTGPLCRYAEDLIPFLKVITLKEFENQLKLDHMVDVKKLKYFYMDEGQVLFASEVHPDIKLCIRKAADYFLSLGCEVRKVNLKHFYNSLPIWISKMNSNKDADNFNFLMGNCVKEINPYVELMRWFLGKPRHTLPAIGLGILDQYKYSQKVMDHYIELNDALFKELQDLLGEDGILLYPTHPLPAPYHNQPLFLPYNFSFTGIFNSLGLPVTAVPMGLSKKEKVPIGLQVIASSYNDRLTCAVAVELEKAFGGWVSPS